MPANVQHFCHVTSGCLHVFTCFLPSVSIGSENNCGSWGTDRNSSIAERGQGLFSDYIRQMACRAYRIVGSSVLPETWRRLPTEMTLLRRALLFWLRPLSWTELFIFKFSDFTSVTLFSGALIFWFWLYSRHWKRLYTLSVKNLLYSHLLSKR